MDNDERIKYYLGDYCEKIYIDIKYVDYAYNNEKNVRDILKYMNCEDLIKASEDSNLIYILQKYNILMEKMFFSIGDKHDHLEENFYIGKIRKKK